MKKSTTEFMSGGEVLPDPLWRMPRHHHVFHELIVVLEGVMTVYTDDGVIVAEAGDLLLYRAGCAHTEVSDAQRPVHTFFIAFQAEPAEIAGLPWQTRDSEARVRQMVTWLVRDHHAGEPPAAQTPLLCAVAREMRRLSASPADPWLTEQRQHMQQNLARTLYLDDLARHARMSKFAFVRKFKRLGGRTPMRELQHLRLNQARVMMLTSGLPVKAVAAAVGLSDEYQLSKLFRRHLRLSPREMRTRSPRGSRAMVN